MNKQLFTLITIILISISFQVKAQTGGLVDKTLERTSDAVKYVTGSSILDSLIPSKKNCNYVDGKLYEPFSDIDSSFPGAKSLMAKGKSGKLDCINVKGGTENLLKTLFTLAISIIIILAVINISISGIQYMTQEAVGKKGEAKKRLINSLIALALGLLSYTILYTVNKQLVSFNFEPGSIDKDGSIDRGIASANSAKRTFSTQIAGIEPVAPSNTPFGNYWNQTSPTGWVNPYTKLPCIPVTPQITTQPLGVLKNTKFLASVYQLVAIGTPSEKPFTVEDIPKITPPTNPNSPSTAGQSVDSNGLPCVKQVGIVETYNSTGSWNETVAENWVRSLPNGSRSTDGRLVVSVFSATKDLDTDKNTADRRGNADNLLREGSVALSPDLISKHRPKTGQEIFINGTSIGFFEDTTDDVYEGVVFNNTVDIYDENGTIGGSYLKNIPVGQWTISFGSARTQIPNPSPRK